MSDYGSELEVLLVEDNASDAELTMDVLRDSRMVNRVQWVKDGAEPLEVLFVRGLGSAAGSKRLELILLDLRLPRVDGLDVLRALRADECPRFLPVVVLTSSHEELDIVRAYHLGANSYLAKPVESAAFMKPVSALGLYWTLLNTLPGLRG